jgi:hypothetical protein
VWYIRLCLTCPPDASRESAHVAADTCRITAESGLCDILTWPKKNVAFISSPFQHGPQSRMFCTCMENSCLPHGQENVQMRLIMN